MWSLISSRGIPHPTLDDLCFRALAPSKRPVFFLRLRFDTSFYLFPPALIHEDAPCLRRHHRPAPPAEGKQVDGRKVKKAETVCWTSFLKINAKQAAIAGWAAEDRQCGSAKLSVAPNAVFWARVDDVASASGTRERGKNKAGRRKRGDEDKQQAVHPSL